MKHFKLFLLLALCIISLGEAKGVKKDNQHQVSASESEHEDQQSENHLKGEKLVPHKSKKKTSKLEDQDKKDLEKNEVKRKKTKKKSKKSTKSDKLSVVPSATVDENDGTTDVGENRELLGNSVDPRLFFEMDDFSWEYKEVEEENQKIESLIRSPPIRIPHRRRPRKPKHHHHIKDRMDISDEHQQLDENQVSWEYEEITDFNKILESMRKSPILNSVGHILEGLENEFVLVTSQY